MDKSLTDKIRNKINEKPETMIAVERGNWEIVVEIAEPIIMVEERRKLLSEIEDKFQTWVGFKDVEKIRINHTQWVDFKQAMLGNGYIYYTDTLKKRISELEAKIANYEKREQAMIALWR